jgi:quinoprotein glucose dehydrogenase
VPRAEVEKKGWSPRGDERGGSMSGAEGAGDPQAGTPFGINVNAGWRLPVTGLLCKQPPYGGIRAIDLKTGKTIWDRPLGQALNNGPFGIPSMLPVNIGTPNNGGSVVTAGGLIFVAAATDDLIRAIDIKTGKTVWEDKLPAGGQATPVTYMEDGRQYVVIMAGGHHFMETPIGDELIAYALPQG